MTPIQEKVLDAARRFVEHWNGLPGGLVPWDAANALADAVEAEKAEADFSRQIATGYVSDQDEEKFDRLLRSPFE